MSSLVTQGGKLVRGFVPTSTRFPNGANQGLNRTTHIPITNYTMCGWVRQWKDTSSGPLFGLTTTNDGSSPTTFLSVDGTSHYELVADGSPGGTPISMFNGKIGIWYFVAFTITTGTTVNLYWYIDDGSNAAGLSTVSSTLSAALSCNFFTIGRALASVCGFDIREQRNWDAVLSSAELFAEAKSLSPVRTANLNSWYPFTTTAGGAELTDASGNGNTLTSNATTPTTVNGAPSFLNQDQNLIVSP